MDDKTRMFVENDLRITCADAVELATDYLEGALVGRDAENFGVHLSLCEGCRVFVGQIEATTKIARTVNEPIDIRADVQSITAKFIERRKR